MSGPASVAPSAHQPAAAPQRRVRDREVVLAAAAVVVFVLALDAVSKLVPPLDRVLTFAPVVVVAMLLVTVVVLYRAVRPSGRH